MTEEIEYEVKNVRSLLVPRWWQLRRRYYWWRFQRDNKKERKKLEELLGPEGLKMRDEFEKEVDRQILFGPGEFSKDLDTSELFRGHLDSKVSDRAHYFNPDHLVPGAPRGKDDGDERNI